MKSIFTNSLSLAVFMYLITALSNKAQATSFDLLGENSRWSIDISSRVSRNTSSNSNEYMHVLGLDVHKVFSARNKDIGTLTFQPYLVSLNNVRKPPLFFKDGDDAVLTWRIANFNFTSLAQGKFNIRVGHFEIPFGIEQNIDSNGTLRQFTFTDRGIKADWGVSINGILPKLEYEIAITRGSGNEIKSTGDPHIFSGRIGTPSHKNFVTGFSWFYGDVLAKNGVTERKKIGIDGAYYYYQWQFMFESSIGKTAGNNTVNTFVEALWKNPRESFSAYLQLGYQDIETNNAPDANGYWVAGLQWINGDGFDISTQYKHKLFGSSANNVTPIFNLQLRYRF